MNSSYNVSSSALHFMNEEFWTGDEICEAVGGHGEKHIGWPQLFEPFLFFEAYKNNLQIDISAKNNDDLVNWKACGTNPMPLNVYFTVPGPAEEAACQ
ncbi:hypothetical protein RJ641_012189, partial [Dillenia turbinata]